MAWFNDAPAHGPALAPASAARARALFDAEGFNYHWEDDVLYTGFQGIPMNILDTELVLAVGSQLETELNAEEYADQMLNWVRQWHGSHFAPTCHVYVDEDTSTAGLRIDVALPKAWEYTDAQFQDNLMAFIEALTECGVEFLKEFNPGYFEEDGS